MYIPDRWLVWIIICIWCILLWRNWNLWMIQHTIINANWRTYAEVDIYQSNGCIENCLFRTEKNISPRWWTNFIHKGIWVEWWHVHCFNIRENKNNVTYTLSCDVSLNFLITPTCYIITRRCLQKSKKNVKGQETNISASSKYIN